jgi:hypothetical protein
MIYAHVFIHKYREKIRNMKILNHSRFYNKLHVNQDRQALLLHTKRNCVVESIGRLSHYGREYFTMTMTQGPAQQ